MKAADERGEVKQDGILLKRRLERNGEKKAAGVRDV